MEVFGVDEVTATDPTLSGVNPLTHLVATTGTIVTFTMPAGAGVGRAVVIRSVIKFGGYSAVSKFGVFVKTSANFRVLAVNETFENDPTFGSAVIVNQTIRAVGGGDVPLSRTLTAGAGLTGGGDLTADRTFDIGANGDGSITVNANDIQVGVINDTQHGTRGGDTTHAVATTSVAGFQSAQGKRIEQQSYENCKYQLNAAAIAGFNPATTSAADWDGATAGAAWTADVAAGVRLLNQSTGVIYTLTTATTCTATGETALYGALLDVPGSAGAPTYRQTAATGAGTAVFVVEPINLDGTTNKTINANGHAIIDFSNKMGVNVSCTTTTPTQLLTSIFDVESAIRATWLRVTLMYARLVYASRFGKPRPPQ